MPLILKNQKSKFGSHNQLQIIVRGAVNVPMNDVVFDDNGANKTYITDGLATCAAVALYGENLSCTTAFTHMSSESTQNDDKRKELILNNMLEFNLKTNLLKQLRLIVSPSGVEESHLIHFIEQWAKNNKIPFQKISKGADSAVFNRDCTGKALMLATSLKLQEMDGAEKYSNHWKAKGFVIAKCGHGLEVDSYQLNKTKEPLFNGTTFFNCSNKRKKAPNKLTTLQNTEESSSENEAHNVLES
jgi:hypothetical protein